MMMWSHLICGRAILSAPDPLSPLASRDDEPLFSEAWQAQALAMADTLLRAGAISAGEWADALGAAVRMQDDTREGYYRAVLAALETTLASTGLSPADISERRDAWADAYRQTPHGQPVTL